MTAIAYGLIIGFLIALAWGLAWTLCARHSFWKMQANYIRQSDEAAEAARVREMQETLDRIRLESASPEDEPGAMPPVPPTPKEAAAFGWMRKKRAS